MARKQGLKGRRAISTPSSTLFRNLESVNKRVTSLRKAGLYGHYASKDIIRLIASEDSLIVDKKTGKIKIKKPKLLKPAQVKLISKRFQTFIRQPTSTVGGIKEVQNKINEKVKDKLSQYTDQEITDEDLEDFFDLTQNEDFRYLADKIGDSELYVILDYSEKNNLSYDDFERNLRNYIQFTNNSDSRVKAKRLYNKFIDL